MPKQPFFSIIIPTLNEEKYLPLLLSDLENQTFTDFEVIHIDGNSEDKTVSKAKKWSKKLQLKTEQTKTRNVAFQRNTGGQKAKGPWLIFMDADNRLPNYFLQGIRYKLDKNPKTDIFTTWIEVENKTRKYQTIETAINFNQEISKTIGKEIGFGAMIGVKKEIFNDIKFDEKQKVAEDAIFIQNVIKNGYHFNLFRDPTYFYSMRRLEKEGTFKMVIMTSQLAIRHIQGKKFSEKNYGYKMEGGEYYEKITTSPLRNILSTIESASDKQLQKVKQILNNFKNIT